MSTRVKSWRIGSHDLLKKQIKAVHETKLANYMTCIAASGMALIMTARVPKRDSAYLCDKKLIGCNIQ